MSLSSLEGLQLVQGAGDGVFVYQVVILPGGIATGLRARRPDTRGRGSLSSLEGLQLGVEAAAGERVRDVVILPGGIATLHLARVEVPGQVVILPGGIATSPPSWRPVARARSLSSLEGLQ